MAGPAAALLAAFNGKPTTTPGNNYGGYNPFSGSIGQSATDPGQQAQNEVAQGQSDYNSQQLSNSAQLASALQPYSVGGTLQQNPGSNATDPNAARLADFNNRIAAINQQGIDATTAAQQQTQSYWNTQFQNMASQFQKNSTDANNWLQSTLQNIQAQTQSGASSGFDIGLYGQLIPTGADPNANIGARAVAIAKMALGTPYVYGGNSLTQGVDCSGLVQQVYERLGIQLPRTSTEQAKAGKVVPSLSQALPGDLILMYSPYEPAGLQQYGHVGIYIGNGMMLDAPHTGAVVRIEPIVNMTGIVRPW
jgi:cell wall-associated NlpC family hydrolase